MPTPEQWQGTLSGHGFDLELDTDFDVETFQGYLPCLYKGQECGFEYFRLAVAEAGYTAGQLKDVGDRDTVVSFTTRSDSLDLLASVVASGALCATADGVLFDGNYDGEANSVITSAGAIPWARSGEADISRDL